MSAVRRIKFRLNGCDISFDAEAPEDMTLKQLLEQADRIKPQWCACGIRSLPDNDSVELSFDYDDVKKVRPAYIKKDSPYYDDADNWGICCTILPKGEKFFNE